MIIALLHSIALLYSLQVRLSPLSNFRKWVDMPIGRWVEEWGMEMMNRVSLHHQDVLTHIGVEITSSIGMMIPVMP